MNLRIPSVLALCVVTIIFPSCNKLAYLLDPDHHSGGHHNDSTTVTISPVNNQSEVHLFGNDNGFDQSGLSSPEVEGGAGTYDGSPVGARALLKFDLTGIPANAKITSARLTLYSNHTPLNGVGDKTRANYGSNNAILISRVVDSWIPSQMHWSNQPSVTDSDQIIIPHTDAAFLDLVDIDVKNLIKSMLKQNNGFQIRLQDEQLYTWRIFCSSKYSDSSRIPKLEISYK